MRFHIDFETESYLDLTEVGTHRYFSHPSTGITHFTADSDRGLYHWRLDRPDPRAVYELLILIEEAGERDIVAHNAAFEYGVIKHILPRQFKIDTSRITPRNMDCTMARALVRGLPASLDKAAKALGLDMAKDKEAVAALRRQFGPSKWVAKDAPPCFNRELDAFEVYNALLGPKLADAASRYPDPKDYAKAVARAQKAAEKKTREVIDGWKADYELISVYNIKDVEIEEAIDALLPPLPDDEFETWVLDQEMNLRGVQLNLPLIKLLQGAVELATERADLAISTITGGAIRTAGQTKQIKAWLNERGIACSGVSKDKMDNLSMTAELLEDDEAVQVLAIRKSAGQSAVKKLARMLVTCDEHGVSRNLLQYYGAATGRWAGRLWQPQNIKRLTEDALARFDKFVAGCTTPEQVLQACDETGVDFFESIGEAMRSLMIAPPGHVLVSGDFSNIEGRGNAWLAGEEWKLSAFREFDAGVGPDLYKLAYAKAFGLLPGEVTKDQRQIGKVMELALGYQGGPNAFAKMAATFNMRFDEDLVKELVTRWREAHPAIRQSWYDYQQAAIDAVLNPGEKFYCAGGRVRYQKIGDTLYCITPARGFIAYAYPEVVYESYKGNPRPVLEFMGVDSTTSQWTKKRLYGGLLCENVTQRVARDVMVAKIKAALAQGFDVRLHVHDELICVDKDRERKAELEALMQEPLDWCPGFPIAAACWADERYIK